jgi:deoxycytidine triphosphate deaminase
VFLTDTDIQVLKSPSSDQEFNEEDPGTGNWENSSEQLLIYPFINARLTPVGYDLTIGELYVSLTRKAKFTLAVDADLIILPHETLLIMTEEYIGLPKNKSLGGLIESKVSMVSKGLSHVSTTVDPDYEGHLLVAVTNQQSYPITLRRLQTFCTVVFLKANNAATKPCGRPPGRHDIIEELLDRWLGEAREAEREAREAEERAKVPLYKRPRFYMLMVIFVIIVVAIVLQIIALLWSESTEAPLVLATVGLVLATLVLSLVSLTPYFQNPK